MYQSLTFKDLTKSVEPPWTLQVGERRMGRSVLVNPILPHFSNNPDTERISMESLLNQTFLVLIGYREVINICLTFVAFVGPTSTFLSIKAIMSKKMSILSLCSYDRIKVYLGKGL